MRKRNPMAGLLEYRIYRQRVLPDKRQEERDKAIDRLLAANHGDDEDERR